MLCSAKVFSDLFSFQLTSIRFKITRLACNTIVFYRTKITLQLSSAQNIRAQEHSPTVWATLAHIESEHQHLSDSVAPLLNGQRGVQCIFHIIFYWINLKQRSKEQFRAPATICFPWLAENNWSIPPPISFFRGSLFNSNLLARYAYSVAIDLGNLGNIWRKESS